MLNSPISSPVAPCHSGFAVVFNSVSTKKRRVTRLAALRRSWQSELHYAGRTYANDAAVPAAAEKHSARYPVAVSARRFLRDVFRRRERSIDAPERSADQAQRRAYVRRPLSCGSRIHSQTDQGGSTRRNL